MISYHPDSPRRPVGTTFTRGFLTADTNAAVVLARGVLKYAWAPGIFEQGYRCKANFLFADWIGLDFETHEFTLAQAERKFCDMVHVIGTTRSHGLSKDGAPPVDRFRVLIQLEKRCHDRAAFEATLKAIRKVYPIDKACIDAARHFFPCKDIISVQDDGFRQEIIPPEPARLRPVHFGIMPARVRRLLASVVPVGARNTTFYGVGKDLMRAGFSAENALTLIVESETYRGEVTPEIYDELAKAIANGGASLAEEAAADERFGRGENKKPSRREG